VAHATTTVLDLHSMQRMTAAAPATGTSSGAVRASFIVASVLLGLLVVPPLLFAVFLALSPGRSGGHPPPIIIPYLYLLYGLRFVAPAAGLLFLLGALLPGARAAASPRRRGIAIVLGALLLLGCAAAWLHSLR
jgi:hypothetical protein